MAVERGIELAPELSIYRSGRWVRAKQNGATIVDSRRPLLVWEGRRPVAAYAFPREDVDAGWIAASGEDVVRTYDDPDLAGYVNIAWDALDHWYEEDEEVFVHPRDPFHRVDALPSSRSVRIERDGRLIAESERPVLLFETGLPTRYYLPRDDFDGDLLRPSESHTGCPYKGTASYFDVVIGERSHHDLVWCYPDPLTAVAAIAGLFAAYNERVDLTVDGEPQERPRTPWSRVGEDA